MTNCTAMNIPVMVWRGAPVVTNFKVLELSLLIVGHQSRQQLVLLFDVRLDELIFLVQLL